MERNADAELKRLEKSNANKLKELKQKHEKEIAGYIEQVSKAKQKHDEAQKELKTLNG